MPAIHPARRPSPLRGPAPERLGPAANGTLMTPEEFDAADFDPPFRYELLQGVLVVSPPPLLNERDPNDELAYWLRAYQRDHPEGHHLDLTAAQHELRIGPQRRTADRVIWCGLGRLPRPDEPPQIVLEMVSAGRRNREQDYEEKLREYPTIGVREYLVFDRFQTKLTVYLFQVGKARKKVLGRKDVYTTPLLPGLELPLGPLFDLANRWGDLPE